MYLNQLVDEFLRSQHYAVNTEKQYRNRLLRLSKYEENVQTPIYAFSAQQMQDAMHRMTDNIAVWKVMKSVVGAYFSWLANQGIDVSIGMESLSKIDSEQIKNNRTKSFFYSTQQLLSKINQDTLYAAEQDGRYQSDYRMVVCTFLLSWLGFKLSEIVKFEKSSIKPGTSSVLKDDKWIAVDLRIIEKLKECADAISYSQNTGYTKCFPKYCESPYLLRTNVRPSMSIGTIWTAISTFNKKLQVESDPYRVEKIFWSGIFSAAYDKELEEGGFPENMTAEEKMDFYGDLFHEKYVTQRQVKERLAEYATYTSILRNTGY